MVGGNASSGFRIDLGSSNPFVEVQPTVARAAATIDVSRVSVLRVEVQNVLEAVGSE